MSEIPLHFHGPSEAHTLVILAHGAGADSGSDFMQFMAEGIAQSGCRVALFDFPYMIRARAEQRRRPPDRLPRLIDAWQDVLVQAREGFAGQLVIGGKSMGGRVASLVFEESAAEALLLLGYPFHPAGRPEKRRVDHLRQIKKPTLVIQGERDALGNRSEVDSYRLGSPFQVAWLTDGDHSFKPRKKSGWSQQQHWQQAVEWSVEWLASLG